MTVDLTFILKLLRWILHILETMPKDMDHQPIAETAREMIDGLLGITHLSP